VTRAGDAGTFVSLESLVEDFLALDRDAFLAKHPDDVIVFDELALGEDPGFQTLAKKPPGKDGAVRGAREKLLDRLGETRWVFPLKKPTNKFAAMITIGRAANNALRLNVPSVSKFHAYLTHVAREGAWYVADANSSNGTFLEGQDLPPSHGKVKLEAGSALRFGPDVTGRFYDAAAVWELLQNLRDQGSAEGPVLRDGA
jgi:hypothetical protein